MLQYRWEVPCSELFGRAYLGEAVCPLLGFGAVLSLTLSWCNQNEIQELQ